MDKDLIPAFPNTERSYFEGGTTVFYKKPPNIPTRAVTKGGNLKENVATVL
jgi:hypothetical protein